MRRTDFVRHSVAGMLFGAAALLSLAAIAGPAQAQAPEQACALAEMGEGQPVFDQPSKQFQETFCAEDDGDDGDDGGGNGGDTTTTTTTTTTEAQPTTTALAADPASAQGPELPATGSVLVPLAVGGGGMIALGLGLRRFATGGGIG